MVETCPNLVFETPKAKIILDTLFINHFYFELQVQYLQCILGVPMYILTLKQTFLVIDGVLVHKSS